MRYHCFVTALRDVDVRWMWHAQTAAGNGVSCSSREFGAFGECVKDALVHGFRHVEVPVLGSMPAPLAGTLPAVTVPQDVATEEVDTEDDDFTAEVPL